MSLTIPAAVTSTSPIASAVAGYDAAGIGGQPAGSLGAPAVAADKNGSSGIAPQAQPAAAGATVKLSDEALDQLRKLQARDRQVRDHEQAHLAAAGGLATSGPSYSYQKGPDGVSYAVGGEVHIDVSPGRTPQDTIARAKTIQAAALAPADPSGPDLAIAAQARQMEQQAAAELQQQQAQQQQDKLTAAYSAGDQAQANRRKIDSYA
ncbi:MAG: putative metalloprotease CJM1_0395 family protein [Pseudomonadota bacterium]